MRFCSYVQEFSDVIMMISLIFIIKVFFYKQIHNIAIVSHFTQAAFL